MNMFKKTITLVLGLLLVTTANAADIKLGTGSQTGNYFAMGKDLVNYCESSLVDTKLEVLPSDGSIANLVGMQNKQYTAGIVQEDVLQYYAKRSPEKVNKNRIKVISALHTEAIHLLIPKDYKPEGSSKGWLSIFDSNKEQKLDLDLLKNQSVGSWGGSIVSAEALSYFFNLNINVVDIPEKSRSANDINLPIILVGGYPYKPVDDLLKSGKFNLISLDYDKISQTASFYNKQVLNYTIDGKIKSVPTIGIRALLLGQSFRNKEKNVSMTSLAECIDTNLADMADDSTTSPLWNSVYEFTSKNGQVDWSYFPIKGSKQNEDEDQ